MRNPLYMKHHSNPNFKYMKHICKLYNMMENISIIYCALLHNKQPQKFITFTHAISFLCHINECELVCRNMRSKSIYGICIVYIPICYRYQMGNIVMRSAAKSWSGGENTNGGSTRLLKIICLVNCILYV